MLTIFSKSEQITEIKNIIDSENRLNELIDFQTIEPYNCDIIIDKNEIKQALDWSDEIPPILLSNPLTFNVSNLLTLVFLKLGNWEKVYEYSSGDKQLSDDIDLINRLQSGVLVQIPNEPINDFGTFEHYRRWHNRAVILHYGNTEKIVGGHQTKNAYEKALENAPSVDYKAFTSKQYASFLLDNGFLLEAEEVLENCLEDVTETSIQAELKAVLYGIWLQELTVPYNYSLLEKTKQTIWEVLQHYENQGRILQTGLLLIDAAQVANFTDSFAESLGYINRAIKIFRDEEIKELEANAHYRKGVLLFTWAQNGSVQFYKGAMEAYQEALKTFTQESTPDVFAEIQHHLGVIYSEIPDEIKKKSIWAAVSVSSFKQALSYFTIQSHPYEYATICNHYANALTKYPEAKLTDNYRKALSFYDEALLVRTAYEYPYERTLTLLNYLEACWQVYEEDSEKQRILFDDMMDKANEIKNLVDDEKLVAEANSHIEKLKELAVLL
jgi:tetratricopeptide (TPR) repeat protein